MVRKGDRKAMHHTKNSFIQARDCLRAARGHAVISQRLPLNTSSAAQIKDKNKKTEARDVTKRTRGVQECASVCASPPGSDNVCVREGVIAGSTSGKFFVGPPAPEQHEITA